MEIELKSELAKPKMRSYLSFGGGVNSVAMLLMLHEQKEDFEAVFVNHGTDWPETYEYLEMLQGWLEKKGLPKITVLKPNVTGFDNLYEYCWEKKLIPSRQFRWCSDKFKINVLHKYCEPPAFSLIGFGVDEMGRAKISVAKGFENRYPLIEQGVTRRKCKDIIKSHGLPVPIKSACFICFNQKPHEWKKLRRVHPDLFCKAEQLENREGELRMSRGKKPLFICKTAPLSAIIDAKQERLWVTDEYPPCNCML